MMRRFPCRPIVCPSTIVMPDGSSTAPPERAFRRACPVLPVTCRPDPGAAWSRRGSAPDLHRRCGTGRAERVAREHPQAGRCPARRRRRPRHRAPRPVTPGRDDRPAAAAHSSPRSCHTPSLHSNPHPIAPFRPAGGRQGRAGGSWARARLQPDRVGARLGARRSPMTRRSAMTPLHHAVPRGPRTASTPGAAASAGRQGGRP